MAAHQNAPSNFPLDQFPHHKTKVTITPWLQCQTGTPREISIGGSNYRPPFLTTAGRYKKPRKQQNQNSIRSAPNLEQASTKSPPPPLPWINKQTNPWKNTTTSAYRKSADCLVRHMMITFGKNHPRAPSTFG